MKFIKYCEVYRAAGKRDCTGNGITAQNTSVTVITDVPYKMTTFDGKEYYDRPDEDAVEAFAEKNNLDKSRIVLLCDKTNNPIYTPYLKPLDSVWGVNHHGEKLVGPCFGGNYVCVDTHEHKLVRVHDRYDTQEAWDGLSR